MLKVKVLILACAKHLEFIVFTNSAFKIRSEYASDLDNFSIEMFAESWAI
jgi:hypothetical protein